MSLAHVLQCGMCERAPIACPRAGTLTVPACGHAVTFFKNRVRVRVSFRVRVRDR